MGANSKAWSIGWKWTVGDASNPAGAIAVDTTSKALHIADIDDIATDWNVAADSHPTVYIHSATTPATDYIEMYHDATDGHLNVASGNLKLELDGTAELTLTTAALAPTTTDGNALGTASLMWSDLFLASAGVINFNNGNVTLTHAAGKLTNSGALTNTGAVNIDDATESTSTTTGSLQTDGGLACAKDFYAGDDIFLTSGAVLNFDAGDVTLTHAANELALAGGVLNLHSSGSPYTFIAGTPAFTQYTSNASTSGSTSAESFLVSNTQTGAGGVGGRARFYMTTNVALAGWSNALKAEVVYGASGQTTGLGSAFVAELALSAGTTAGTYAALEAEIISNTSCSTGTATSFLYGNIAGTDTSVANTNGYLFELGSGVTDTAGGIFETEAVTSWDATHVLKCRIAGTTYYIPLNTVKAN